MPIEFPRAMPTTRMLRVIFEAEPQEATAPEQGGRFVSVQLGPPLWRATYATTPSTEVEFSQWRAWLDSLAGASRQFIAYDMRRPLPWKYRSGFAGLLRASSGLPFDGTSTKWTINAARDEITVGALANQELPVGFSLIEGDYLGLIWATDKRSLHRVLTPFNASAAGVGVWTIWPPVNKSVPAGAIVEFDKPACLMRVTKRDRDAEHKSRRVSFEAVQDLVF